MNEGSYAGKVGLFVVLGTVLLAVMLIVFSKGLRMMMPTYELRLRAPSVAGLTRRSDVLLSGVRVGKVLDAEVAPGGKGVILRLKIEQRYRIHSDARFVIEQIGFLGDQYVAIYPGENKGPLLKNGDEVQGEEPFNFQEVVRSTSGLVQRFDQTVSNFNMMIHRVDQMVLNERNLTNLTLTLANFRTSSERALAALDQIKRVLETNAPSTATVVSNLVRFSQEINELAGEFHATVATNRHQLTSAIDSFESTSRILNGLAEEIEAGKGIAGSLFKDTELQQNLREAVVHLKTAASNMANYGLLYKPKKPKRESPRPLPPPSRFPWN
jgi:phospholipid/cholesterol/gamma-HCH transport system substrate-binding protein